MFGRVCTLLSLLLSFRLLLLSFPDFRFVLFLSFSMNLIGCSLLLFTLPRTLCNFGSASFGRKPLLAFFDPGSDI